MSEERDDLSREPESGAPDEEAPHGVPGEPGEATPSETAPEPDEEAAPEAVGPEIEGVEQLAGQGEEPAAAGDEAAAADQPAGAGEEAGAADEGAAGEAAEGAEAEPRRERRPRRGRSRDTPDEEVIPGMHLEPDLVLEEQQRPEESEYAQYAEAEGVYETGEAADEAVAEAPAEPEPVAHTPLDLAADARYGATGKRKSAVARVTLKPGEGTYNINGRHLDEYFPRVRLQRMARQPLEAAGYHTRMDVVALIHGGGVSAQATALRHGIARALVEADPALRGELKRRGYLTRDPRVKERKKAGLKKARKRPQFSKR
jgi:small subunit ribosomal protein S9